MFYTSCEKESYDLPSNNKIISTDGEIVNGRFIFRSSESLKQEIEKLERQEIEIVEDKFKEHYNNNFRSHLPFINSDDSELIKKFSQEKNKKSQNLKKTTTVDDADGFINDPYFAAFVNENNEIIVADTLYRYTKNKGLYFAHLRDSTKLFDYLKAKENDFYKSESSICDMRNTNGGVTEVDTGVYNFLAPAQDNCGGTAFGGGSTTVTAEEDINEIINNLPECFGSEGNFFQDLFGDSFYCNKYWTDTRRLHTEFWSQDWHVYASTGIMAKAQRKILGTWHRADVDEIYLGINRIVLKYKFKKPEIQFDPISTYDYVSNRVPIYLYNQEYSIKTNSITGFNDISVKVTKNSLPFFEFDNLDVLNIYIPNLPIIDKDYNLNITTSDIFSDSNIKALYKMGIDFLKNKVNSKKDFVVTYQKTPEEIVVVYFGEQHHESNSNLIKRYFYKDSGFVFKALVGDNPTGGQLVVPDDNNLPYVESNFSTSLGFEGASDFFRKYTYYDLDFYGLGKRNSAWKGTRMNRSE